LISASPARKPAEATPIARMPAAMIPVNPLMKAPREMNCPHPHIAPTLAFVAGVWH
jgi:hypothetical protein